MERRLAEVPRDAETSAGDRTWETCEALVRRYHDDLHAFAFRLVGSREDAEDALQSAYVKALRATSRDSGPLSVNAPWLYRIVYRACVDQRRRLRRLRHDALDEQLVAGGTASRAAALATALSQALLRLPASTRAAVLLVDVHGLSYDEAADALDVPRGTIASRLNHGRASLRATLIEFAPNGGDDD